MVNDLAYTKREVNRLLQEVGLRDSNQSPPSGLETEEIIDVIEGARGTGHTISSSNELGKWWMGSYTDTINELNWSPS